MALPEPIKLTVERFHSAHEARVSEWVGIEHRRQRGTEHARVRTLVTECRADAGRS